MFSSLLAYVCRTLIDVRRALTLILITPKAKWMTAILFLLLFNGHLIILPANVIGTDIGLRSFQHLNAKIILFSFLFALFETVLISIWVYLIRHKTRCKTAPAAGGMLIGLVSPLLCCTPLLPTLLSLIAVVSPSAVSAMGFSIQYSVNVYQTELLILALILLIMAIVQNVHYLDL